MSDRFVEGARAAPIPPELLEQERARAKAAAERGPTIGRPDTTSRALRIEGAIRDTGAPPSDEPHWATTLRYCNPEGHAPAHVARAWNDVAYQVARSSNVTEPARWWEIGEAIERTLEKRARAKREARR